MTEPTTNIGKRILEILKERGIKPTPFEEDIDVSRGYFKKVADSGSAIGTEIVEKILLKFSDVDAYWLITGKSLSGNTEKNITSVRDKKLLKEKQQLIDGLFINKKEADKLIDDLYNHIRTLEGLEGEQLPKHQASPSKN